MIIFLYLALLNQRLPHMPVVLTSAHSSTKTVFRQEMRIRYREAASPSWEGQWQKGQTSPTGDINTWAGQPQAQAQCTECWILRASLLWCINLEYRYWNLLFLLPVGRDYMENLLPLHQGRREAGSWWGNVSPILSSLSPTGLHSLQQSWLQLADGVQLPAGMDIT